MTSKMPDESSVTLNVAATFVKFAMPPPITKIFPAN